MTSYRDLAIAHAVNDSGSEGFQQEVLKLQAFNILYQIGAKLSVVVGPV